jgi:hypothetical protein
MSGQPYRNALDIAKFRSEYLANLGLQASINDANLQANKIYVRTGAPTQPTDTRTTTEKLADLYRIRIDIRSKLGDIMSGDDAQNVVEGLDDNEAKFLAQQLPTITADLKPKYRLGVPADIFNQYFQKYMNKYQETQGVEYNLQQSSGQQMLANQRLILTNMASKSDINDIEDAIREVGMKNTAIGKQISVNLKQIEDVLDALPETFDAINETNNAILKAKLLEGVNGLVAELPTKSQLTDLLHQLAVAQEKRDVITTDLIMRRIAGITDYAGDLQEELRTLRFQIRQAGGEEVQQAIPLGEVSAMKSGGDEFGSVNYSGLEYTYVPSRFLSGMKKTSQFSEPNMVDYIEAMKKANPSALRAIRVLNVAESTLRSYDKTKLQGLLTSNDRAIQELWRTAPASTSSASSSTQGKQQGNIQDFFGKKDDKIGKGFKMYGGGVKNKVDYNAGILPTANYVPFGNYLINRKKLEDGIVMIKRHSGQFMGDMKTKRVSPNLTTIFKKVSGGQLPSFNDYEKLDDDEREYLQYVAKKSNLADKLQVPSPKKDKTEQLVNQFEIMRGQIIAGNDSKELLKKFKSVLVELAERDLIPKGQMKDILIEIMKKEF